MFWEDLRWAKPVKIGRLALYVSFLALIFWLVYACFGIASTRGLPGHPLANAMRWFGWPFFDVAVDFPGVSRGEPFNPITTPSTWRITAASIQMHESVVFALLLSAFWPLGYLGVWLASKCSPFTPQSIARAFGYSFIWIVFAAPLAAGNTWRNAKLNFSTPAPGELSIQPSTAFDSVWWHFHGVSMPMGWFFLDSLTLPIVLCVAFGWWWISAASAHGLKRAGMSAVLIIVSLGLVLLWQMRPAVLLVWLDVKEFFR